MKRQPSYYLFYLLLFACFLISYSVPASADEIYIKDIRYSNGANTTKVVIEFESLPEYKSNMLHNPERLYFDLKGVLIDEPLNVLNIKSSHLKKIRLGYYRKNILRIVFDLKGRTEYKVFTLKSPPRLVIEFGKDRNPFYRERKVVVIDAGHGGHDPGAIGPGGLKEKDVTLDIAKRLKRVLEERYNLIVYLTRNTDRFLELKERTRIANKKGADLFISIHANASPRRQTRGIETYLLNWTNDEEALRVAARENAISVEKMKKQQTELGMILASLHRESKRDESLKLAHYIQNSLVSSLSRKYRAIQNLGVKQALFYVLVDAEMPSVLVEVGFISNPREERLLKSRSFRQKTAEALAHGIFRYILSLPDAPKLAMNRTNLQ